MDLIVTDTNGTPSGSYASWTLDLAYGSGENDFAYPYLTLNNGLI